MTIKTGQKPKTDETINMQVENLCVGRKLLLCNETDDFYPDNNTPFYIADQFGNINMLGEIELGDAVPVSRIPIEESIPVSPVNYADREQVVMDKLQKLSVSKIMKKETADVVGAMIKLAEEDELIVVNVGTLAPASLFTAFGMLQRANEEEDGIYIGKVVMNPVQYSLMSMWGRDLFDEAPVRERLMSNLYGHISTADIHVTNAVPNNVILVCCGPEQTGEFAITKVPTSKISEKDGKVTYELRSEFGFGLYKKRCAKIEIAPGTKPTLRK